MADTFKGKWKLTTSENFDEYMKKLGVGMLLRKAGNLAKPVMEFVADGDKWKVTSVSTVKTVIVEFTLGQEFDETTADGRKCKSTFTLEGDKLVQIQKATKDGEKDSTLTRYIEGDELITICECDGVECKRIYKKQ